MIRRWLGRLLNTEARQAPMEPAEWEAMSARIETDRDDRRAAVESQRDVADAISAILFRHDPVGISYEHNTDEYDAEAESILIRLAATPQVESPEEIKGIVHDEFVRWFDEDIAGPPERYGQIAQEIWHLWSDAGTEPA